MISFVVYSNVRSPYVGQGSAYGVIGLTEFFSAVYFILVFISSIILGFILFFLKRNYINPIPDNLQFWQKAQIYLNIKVFIFAFTCLCIKILRNIDEASTGINSIFAISCLLYVCGILLLKYKARLRIFLFLACLLLQGYLVYPFVVEFKEYLIEKRKQAWTDAASSPLTNEKQIRVLFEKNEMQIIEALAENSNTPEDVLRSIYAKDIFGIENKLAKNIHTPTDVLKDLAKKGYYSFSNPSFQNLNKQVVKKLNTFVVLKPIVVQARTGWWKEGDFSCTLPEGLILQAYEDEQKIYGDFWLVPSKHMEKVFVPEKVRESPNYRGYYFVFSHEDIGPAVESIDAMVSNFDDSNPNDFAKIGVKFNLQKRYSLSIGVLQTAVELFPINAELYAILALAYHGIGQKDKEIAALLKAVKIKPDYGDAYILLGELYGELGRKKEALVILENAREIFFKEGKSNIVQKIESLINKISR